MAGRQYDPNELSRIITEMSELSRRMSQSQGLRNLLFIIDELRRRANQSEELRNLLYVTAELSRRANQSQELRQLLSAIDEVGSRLRQFDELVEVSTFNPAFVRYLTHTYAEFSEAFLNLQQSAGTPRTQSRQMSHIVISSSHLEHANETQLLGTLIGVSSESEVIEEHATPSILPTAVEGVTGVTLEGLLNDLDPRLLHLWLGALEARESNNVDRVRHSMTSLRELFTHVVHAIAPDHEVKQWSDDPNHYHNGQPTRRARMLFVVRNVNDESLSAFVDKDVSACLKLLNILQEGVHTIESPYRPSQVNAIEIRFEYMLRFLLQVGRLE